MALHQLTTGVFSQGDTGLFQPLVDDLLYRDPYLVLADFQADFVCCHLMHLPVYLDHLASHEADPPYERFLPGEVPVCTMLRAEELAGLFPVQNHEQDGSAVLVPRRWEPGDGEGCLAIGSRTTNRFASDMDTLFVTYIGEVLGRVITRLAT